MIYYPPTFFSSNIGKKKIFLTYKNQNFCLKTFTFSDLLTHTIFRNSLNIFKVLILSFLDLHAFSATQKKIRFQTSSEFQLFFFSANAGHNKKESEGVVSLVRHYTYMKSRGTLTSEIHVQFSPWELISCGRVGTKILMSWRRSSWRGRRGIEVSKIDMSLNKNSKGILGNVCVLVSFAWLDCFSFDFFKYIAIFCRQSPFYMYSWPNTFNSSTWSHPLIFFEYKILSSSHLQIFSPSPPHTFSVAKTHMPKSPNLDICSAKLSNILTSNSSIFFILQTSRLLNLRSSQFQTLSSAASRQKHPQEQRFPVLLLGKNRTTGAENFVPIDSKCMCSQGRKKPVPVLL